MIEFYDGEKVTVSYTNKDGGYSRISAKKEMVDNIESVTGYKWSAWVQMQHDDIISGHKRYEKYMRVLKIKGKPLTTRRIGCLIRLVAISYDSIPDSDFL